MPATPERNSLSTGRRWLSGLAMAAAVAPAPAALAGTDAYIGEILWTAATFCPSHTLEANGQLMAISQYTALFSLLGTTYGGNGSTTFALPDLRGRSSIHQGAGPGLSARILGELGGAESATLTVNQLPSHHHTLNASSGDGASGNPANGVLASPKATATTTTTASGTGTVTVEGKGKNGRPTTSPVDLVLDVDVDVAVGVATYGNPGTANVQLAPESIGSTGGSQPVDTQSPYLTLRACVAVAGIYPSR